MKRVVITVATVVAVLALLVFINVSLVGDEMPATFTLATTEGGDTIGP